MTVKTKKDPLVVGVLHVALKSGARLPARSAEACLEEAVGLSAALDLNVVFSCAFNISKKASSTLLGKGNVDNISDVVSSKGIQLIIIDGALSPLQQRNLEKKWQCKVIDRTGLILEIFGKRARTAEGVLQVELASLLYQRSRLVRSWTHLERQRGGFGFTGGPGESQLELDRRLIDDRIFKLKKQLNQATRTRTLHRTNRQDVPYPVVALVGYTNAGKSTLFNHLTNSKVLAQDLLFATLDPTMRKLKLPSGRTVILSDTVGFISNLPTQLVAAFKSTLEEVCSADVIIHVQDCSHPDSSHQAEDVLSILSSLGLESSIEDGGLITAFNKIDLLSSQEQEPLYAGVQNSQNNKVVISAYTGQGCESLLKLIDKCLNRKRLLIHLKLPAHAGDLLAWLYSNGAIIDRHDKNDFINLNLQITEPDLEKIKLKYPGFFNPQS